MECYEIDRETFYTIIAQYVSTQIIQSKGPKRNLSRIVDILKSFPLFASLNSDQLISIANNFIYYKYKAGDTIISNDSGVNLNATCIDFHIINSGVVHVYHDDSSNVISTGHIIGELQGTFDGMDNSILAVAEEDVETLSIPKNVYSDIIKTVLNNFPVDRATSKHSEDGSSSTPRVQKVSHVPQRLLK